MIRARALHCSVGFANGVETGPARFLAKFSGFEEIFKDIPASTFQKKDK